MKKEKLQFGDLVNYDGNQYRYIGMCEDGEISLVSAVEHHAFGVVTFETVWANSIPDMDTIELVQPANLMLPNYKSGLLQEGILDTVSKILEK